MTPVTQCVYAATFLCSSIFPRISFSNAT